MPRDKTGHVHYSWFPSIFQKDTNHLSLAEVGAFRRLMDFYILTRTPLMANDLALAWIVGVPLDEWQAVKPRLLPFFTSDGTSLRNAFCDATIRGRYSPPKAETRTSARPPMTIWMTIRNRIQPYDFGYDASKSTCLWLKNMPPLQPTTYIAPRISPDGKERWANQTDSGQNKLVPSEGRAMERSRTYQGTADAMADQWGGPAHRQEPDTRWMDERDSLFASGV